jgi:manganese/zinc/iron transport system substrate-binding protein
MMLDPFDSSVDRALRTRGRVLPGVALRRHGPAAPVCRLLSPVHLSLTLAIASLLGGCNGDGPEVGDIAGRQVRVVATTSMIADLARDIGGDRVDVEGLMGPGVDPHLYRASEGDVARLAGADVVLYNGLHLEGRMAEVLEQMDGLGIPSRAVAEEVPDSLRITSELFQSNVDPHVWMDPTLWRYAARAVAEQLSQVDSANADVYGRRLVAFEQRMDGLDAWVRSRVDALPPPRRILVTAHDAFGYFGRAYGFEVRGLQGISTATEAGTGDVQELAAFVALERVPAMFVESSVPPRAIEAVRAAVRARGHEVEIGGNLFSDALGDARSGADTYEGMIRHNVETIVRALESASE